MGKKRFCPCGAPATGSRGTPRCMDCRTEKVRAAQKRYRDKNRGSYVRGRDSEVCTWCEARMIQRPYEVGSPRRFCSEACGYAFQAEQRRVRTRLERRCQCGGPARSKTGVPVCESCYAANQDRLKRRAVLRVYGIDVEDYDRMFSEQGGRCAICRSESAGSKRKVFAVDHCHETNQVRGLLCYACNTGIGHLGDSPHVVAAALRYLSGTSPSLVSRIPAQKEPLPWLPSSTALPSSSATPTASSS